MKSFHLPLSTVFVGCALFGSLGSQSFGQGLFPFRGKGVGCDCQARPPVTLPIAFAPAIQPQIMISSMVPVPQASVTAYRDEIQTEYREEKFVQQIPVTTYKQVTVDEGAYQMVWVPKMVNKQVASTEYKQEVKTRSVPVQIVKRVPVQIQQPVAACVPSPAIGVMPLALGGCCGTMTGAFMGAPQSAWLTPQAQIVPQAGTQTAEAEWSILPQREEPSAVPTPDAAEPLGGNNEAGPAFRRTSFRGKSN